MIKLKDLGEKGFIKNIIEENKRIWIWGPLKPGDDASAVPYLGGYIILKIDGFASHDSKYPWNTWRDFGWKAVTACVSDILSKGGKPFAYLISLGMPGDMSVEDGLEIMRGVAEAIDYYGGYLAGGDTNSSKDDVWIDVACVGHSPNDPIGRNAQPGDHIIITGDYGLTGLAYLLYLKYLDKKIDIKDVPHEVVLTTSRPRAPIETYDLLNKYRKCIRGSVDISDSLAESLYLLSEFSGYSIKLHDIPINSFVREFSSKENIDPMELALYGGEEFQLILSIDPSCTNDFLKDLKRRNINADVYGVVTEERRVAVYLKEREIYRKGFQHF